MNTKRWSKKAQSDEVWALIAVGAIIALLVLGIFLRYGLPSKDETTTYTTTNTTTYNPTYNSRLYPNYNLTPGDILTTNKSIICVTGYSSTVRNVSTSLKKQIYMVYNLSYPQPTGMYELEHFVALSLGGSNDPKNLWVMPNPEHNWKTKVDRYLLDQVCDENNMTVEEAQQIILTDWYAYYIRINNSD